MLTLGSLFDGIGGWLLAAKHAGVTPVWASEIDDFPAAVTARHFPDVNQLGDVMEIDGGNIPPVDIICAGSPCQDLSVAGKRAGLAGERSGLFVRAVDIVRQMRRATGGRKPRFFVWENVPGAFSSNHRRDFQDVLSEIGEAEIPMPESGRWADAGLVRTHSCDIAWRVLDAQYWGVPQRRKRIFLVADFAAADRRAAEILFEPEGVRGDSAEGEGAREGAANGTTVGVGTPDGDGSLTPYMQQGGRVQSSDGTSATLSANSAGGAKNVPEGIRETTDVYDMTHADEVMRLVTAGVTNTLNSRMGTGGNQVPVLHYYTIAGNTIGRTAGNGGNGNGFQEGISYTLNTSDRHAVVGALCARDYKGVGNEHAQENKCQIQENTVRRLTPLECERLQGLPDGYTDVEFKGEPAPDSRRYRALGNGMAQPCADFVIRRIVESGKKGIDSIPLSVI